MPYPSISNEGSFGQGFLDAFTQFYGIAGNRKRQKEQDAIAAQDRSTAAEDRAFAREMQLASLAAQGIMPGTAPVEERPAMEPAGSGFRSAFVEAQPKRPGSQPFDEVPPRDFGPQMDVGMQDMGEPTLPEAPAPKPGAFNPMTGTFTPAIPRYRQLTPGLYQDETRTPDARRKAEEAAERERRGANLRAAGIPEERIGLALDAPSIIDNLIATPKGPGEMSRDERLSARIRELTAGGMTLRQANEQARLEFGGSVADEGPQKADRPTDSVRRARLLYNVANQAASTLEQATAPGFLESLMIKAGTNELLDEDRQMIEQSARQFVSSYLYLVSGATATPGEIDSLSKQIVPQRGEGPRVTAQKAAAIRTMKREMAAFAGIEESPDAPEPPKGRWR